MISRNGNGGVLEKSQLFSWLNMTLLVVAAILGWFFSTVLEHAQKIEHLAAIQEAAAKHNEFQDRVITAQGERIRQLELRDASVDHK